MKTLLSVGLLAVVSTLLVWTPFFLRTEEFWGIPLSTQGMATVVANYDGPLYLAVAKTLYDKTLITQNYSFGLPAEYYAAHFPLFPLLIKFFSGVFGYPYSMLFVTIASSVLALYFFYKLATEYLDSQNATWLTIIFSLFPARWLVVRSVGSADPLFVGAIIASVYYFKRKNYWMAGIWGAVAQATKSPGILLFVAYFIILLIPLLKKLANTSVKKIQESTQTIFSLLPLFLIPLSLFLVFSFYKIRMNDFFAYFNSGDNIHLFFPPFQIFNYASDWVGTFWLEEVIFVYLIGLVGLTKLIQTKETVLAWFVGIFFTTIFFVSHRDIVRYALPVVPFLLIAFKDTLITKEFRIIFLILIIPIYLFSITYISQNVMPISDWTRLL